MCYVSGDLIAINAYKLGWKPQWDEQRFLDGIGQEVEDALEFDTGGTSLYNVILPSKA